jgi:hypothetical protein
VGFLRGDLGSVSRAFEEWRRSHQWFAADPQSFGSRSVEEDLDHALSRLLPLSNRRERELLWECEGGGWVSYFVNRQPTDSLTAVGGLCQVSGLTGLVVQCAPSWDSSGMDLQLAVFKGAETRRSVSLVREGSLTFQEYGEPFDFEHVEDYRHKSKAKRLTESHLREYCDKLGLRPWDRTFYRNRGSLFADLRGPGLAQQWRGETDIVPGPSLGLSGRPSVWRRRRDPRV